MKNQKVVNVACAVALLVGIALSAAMWCGFCALIALIANIAFNWTLALITWGVMTFGVAVLAKASSRDSRMREGMNM